MATFVSNRWAVLAAILVVALLGTACAGGVTTRATQQPATAEPVATEPVATEPATAAPAAEAPATVPAASEAGTAAAPLDGTWEGAITIAQQEIAVRFNFKGEGGTVDFPTQAAVGLRMENFKADGAAVSFDVLPKPQTATFTGQVEGDTYGGKFTQSGYEGTFTATRAAAAGETTEEKGYSEEEVSFQNGPFTLAGTLSLPKSDGPYPAVVLISGSGAQNRDEELFGFKPFAILADALTKAGVAVLRYDDRGIGGSTTGTVDDTSETFANDVKSAIKFLQSREDIDGAKIGLLGHSEGGIIAPMVAAETGEPAFLVLLAATGIPGEELLVEQVAAIARAGGADEAAVTAAMEEQAAAMKAVRTGEGLPELRAEMVKQFRTMAEQLPAAQRETLGDLDKWAEQNADMQLGALQSAWMKFFLSHDPAATLEKVDAPVLALFGGKDTQVPPASNEAPMRAALEKGGNKEFTIKVFPDANHLFQAANTGGPDEYQTLAKEFAPGVVETIVEWVTAQVQ